MLAVNYNLRPQSDSRMTKSGLQHACMRVGNLAVSDYGRRLLSTRHIRRSSWRPFTTS